MCLWLPLHFLPTSSVFILSEVEVTKEIIIETAFSLNSMDPEPFPKSGWHLCVCVCSLQWMVKWKRNSANARTMLRMLAGRSQRHYFSLYWNSEKYILYMPYTQYSEERVLTFCHIDYKISSLVSHSLPHYLPWLPRGTHYHELHVYLSCPYSACFTYFFLCLFILPYTHKHTHY